MKSKTTGIFYDGLSSIPQQIELTFNPDNAVFEFESENNSFSWDLKEVLIVENGKTLNLQHGGDPVQNIKIENPDFIANMAVFRNKNGHIGLYQKLMNLGFKTHIAIATAILAIIGLCYFFVVPWVGEKSVVLIPEDYDTQLGKAVFENQMLLNDIDAKKTKALNQFASELNFKNTKKLHFTVVDANVVNAFALPDGNVVVYTGILDAMKNYDELVGLLGHEVAHVNNRHSMKMLCRNLSGYLLISTILGDANGIMAMIGDNANALQSLSFSREFEKQADLDGFKIVTINKVNPKGMSDLFKHLQAEYADMPFSKFKIPEFMSSHPVTTERIRYIDQMIQAKQYQFSENQKLKDLFEELKK